MVKLVLSMLMSVSLSMSGSGVETCSEEPVVQESFEETIDAGVEACSEEPVVQESFEEIRGEGSVILKKYVDMFKENKDMEGYIYLPNGIEYPVMYTPYNQNYYIDHDFNKAESKEGLPFLNRYSLFGSQGISLMYGHNMKSGKIFNVLTHYLEDDGFLEENKYIWADTLLFTQEYEVVAVALTSLNEPFNYYDYVGWMQNKEFNEWKEGFEDYVVRGSLSELTCQDVILELSTCYYHKDDGRLVVILKAK